MSQNFSVTTHLFSIAPMMDWTDRHCRYLHRLIFPKAALYTEMVHSGAILRGDTHRFLQYHSAEHPVILQLGGNDAQHLAQASAIAEQYGYDEVNLNVGCPSDRVQSGAFGACLMRTPAVVVQAMQAMQTAVDLPVTVKCRLAVDNMPEQETLYRFVDQLARVGVNHFIVHARKAWLQGLSPKENREVPPLNYALVYALKRDYPELTITLNGGVQSVEEIHQHLNHVDGVMVGRAAYHDPYRFIKINALSDSGQLSRREVFDQYCEYAEQQLEQGIYLRHLIKPLLGLYNGQPGARRWRRYLSEQVATLAPSSTPQPGHSASDVKAAMTILKQSQELLTHG